MPAHMEDLPVVSNESATAAAADVVYSYKPAVFGPAYEFRLTRTALEWEIGRRNGRVPYTSIRRLRLSFRPVSLVWHRFMLEVWADATPKLQIASTSWRSMTEQQRQDAPYKAFVRELHRRLAEAQTRAVFQTGSSPVVYWPGLVVFGGLGIGVAFLLVRGLQAGSTAGALLVCAFLALFLWQLGLFFYRNRPSRYTPQAIPATVLPRG